MSPLRKLVSDLRAFLEDTGSVNVGVFVRPLGPMLPPAPSAGWENAADIMDPPKREQLDSRPKKKRSKRS